MKKYDKLAAVSLPVAVCVAFCLLVFWVICDIKTNEHVNQIKAEIQDLKHDLKARGELIGRLQQEVDYANDKATWLLRKIDKRRVLIPVMNGDVYKLVEIEAEPEP